MKKNPNFSFISNTFQYLMKSQIQRKAPQHFWKNIFATEQLCWIKCDYTLKEIIFAKNFAFIDNLFSRLGFFKIFCGN